MYNQKKNSPETYPWLDSGSISRNKITRFVEKKNPEIFTNMQTPKTAGELCQFVAAITWMIGSVTSLQHDIVDIKSKMPALITSDGVPTDSPISAERRHNMRNEIDQEIRDLQVRVRLLEERAKNVRN